MRKIVFHGSIVLCLTALCCCSTVKHSQSNSTHSALAPPANKQIPPAENAPGLKAAPFNVPAFAKTLRLPFYQIAVFAPLYLDEAGQPTDSTPGTSLPRMVIPGLDFYEGTLLALDSLRSQGYQLEVNIYDTRSIKPGMEELLRSGKLDSVNLIIGSVNLQDLRLLSAFSKKHEINFISATYPNDGDITDNPFLVILNSTLKTHCEAIGDYARNNFEGNKNILVFSRNNPQEKRTTAYILDAWKSKNDPTPLPVKEILWDDSIPTAILAKSLSAGKNNICIVTALDESAAKNIVSKLASLANTYQINVIGMPDWDGIRDFYGPLYKGLSIFYSTPYYNDKKEGFNDYISNAYFNTYKGRPSDMVFKGFEAIYYFSGLMQLDGVYFNSYINDPRYQIITPFDFEPVYNRTNAQTPDYFENKHLYFIKILDGVSYKAS